MAGPNSSMYTSVAISIMKALINGKFCHDTADVVNTGGKFATGVDATGGKLAADVNNTEGKLSPISTAPAELEEKNLSSTQRYPNKIIKTFLIDVFFLFATAVVDTGGTP